MQSNEYTQEQSLRKLTKMVDSHRLHDAFPIIRQLASMLGDWHITEEIDSIEQSYSMMLRYAMEGANDPQRNDMYESIVSRMMSLADKIIHKMRLQTSPQLFYSTLRYENLQTDDSLQSLIEAYSSLIDKTSLFSLITSDSQSATDSNIAVRETDTLERRIFNRIWTSFPMPTDDASLLASIFISSSSSVPDYFRELIISALLLSLTHYHDETKLNLLLDIYSNDPKSKYAIKALSAALIAIGANTSRINSGRLRRRVEAMRDISPTWSRDVRTVMMELLRSRDTERINKKLNEEIIPKMQELRPDIARRISGLNSSADLSDIEGNPEWEEILDKAGITDKIKELMKIQEEGGDVFMSTFSQLKSFPFFNDPSNWFMPFRADHPAVKPNRTQATDPVGVMLETTEMLCDSDKYSIMLMMQSVPESQRKLITMQLDQQQMAAMELKAATLSTDETARRQAASQYVRSVYRFFKLFRRRSDFNDPFAKPINLLANDIFNEDIADLDTQNLVAEFYFKRNYFEDALSIYLKLADEVPPEVSLYQKMGHCYQHIGNMAEALRYYEQAELLDSENLWTMRRLAAAHRSLGHTETALSYYRRIADLRPDDLNATLRCGHCLLELNRHQEALKCYFKVDYLDPKSGSAIRPIAWCSFIMGDYDQSLTFYRRVLESTPTSTDYLNMGHLHMVIGKPREAINYYSLSVDSNGGNVEQFISDFLSDQHYLMEAGVDPSLSGLVVDAMLYRRS